MEIIEKAPSVTDETSFGCARAKTTRSPGLFPSIHGGPW